MGADAPTTCGAWQSLDGNMWWLPPRGLRPAWPFGRPPAMAAPGPLAPWVGPWSAARSVCRSLLAAAVLPLGAWFGGGSGCSARCGGRLGAPAPRPPRRAFSLTAF